MKADMQELINHSIMKAEDKIHYWFNVQDCYATWYWDEKLTYYLAWLMWLQGMAD